MEYTQIRRTKVELSGKYRDLAFRTNDINRIEEQRYNLAEQLLQTISKAVNVVGIDGQDFLSVTHQGFEYLISLRARHMNFIVRNERAAVHMILYETTCSVVVHFPYNRHDGDMASKSCIFLNTVSPCRTVYCGYDYAETMIAEGEILLNLCNYLIRELKFASRDDENG
jgi:hypothetical protein